MSHPPRSLYPKTIEGFKQKKNPPGSISTHLAIPNFLYQVHVYRTSTLFRTALVTINSEPRVTTPSISFPFFIPSYSLLLSPARRHLPVVYKPQVSWCSCHAPIITIPTSSAISILASHTGTLRVPTSQPINQIRPLPSKNTAKSTSTANTT